MSLGCHALFIDPLHIPSSLPVAQQQRGAGFSCRRGAFQKHLSARGAPRPTPPADPTTARRQAMVPPTSTALPDSAVVAGPAGRESSGQPRRVGREQAAPGHPDRITLGVKQFHRFVEEHRGRRFGQSAWPRLPGVGPRHRFVTQWREGDALGGSTSPAEHRHLHGLRPEQPLHPDQRPPGPQPILVADPTPQRKLQCACGNHLHGLQPQHGDGSGGPVCRDFSGSTSHPTASGSGRRWHPRSTVQRTATPC